MGPPSWFRRLCTARRAAVLLRNCDREIGPVGRGQNANRHAAEIARRSPRTLPDGARILAGDVAKRAAESAEAVPPRCERDVGDWPVGIAQQRGRALDTPREQIAVRREPERLLERARKVRLGHAAHLRETPYGPLLVRGGI